MLLPRWETVACQLMGMVQWVMSLGDEGETSEVKAGSPDSFCHPHSTGLGHLGPLLAAIPFKCQKYGMGGVVLQRLNSPICLHTHLDQRVWNIPEAGAGGYLQILALVIPSV